MTTSIILFANNAQSTLAGPITSTATSVNLQAGTGVLFPTPGAGQYFKMTFVSASNPTLNEIVNVTAVSGDTFTIVRGQEGTTALNWNAGDFAYNFLTAGAMQAMAQSSALSASFYQGTDAGTANAVNVPSLTPSLSVPVAGQVFVITKGAAGNTGGVTMAIASGTAYPVVYKDGSTLNSGDWPANAAALLYFTGAVYQLMACQANIFSQISSFPSISPARNILLSQTAHATGTATVPSGVTWVWYNIVGGGGGGAGGGGSSTWSSGGGASAGTAQGWLAVSPGDTISWTNGQGGAGGAQGNGVQGGTGGTSSITHGVTTISATGGTGGVGGTSTSSGGAPGEGSGGQINLIGAVGGDGNPGNNEVQGGGGGGSSLGGGGRTSTLGGGIPNGLAPGSGGGGIWGNDATPQTGGNGADGAIILMY